MINLLETAIKLLEPPIDVITQIDEVLSESVKTRRRGATKIADLGSDLADVAIRRTGKHPGCRGVLFGCLESSFDFTEIILTHSERLTPRRARRPLSTFLPGDKGSRAVLRIVMFDEKKSMRNMDSRTANGPSRRSIFELDRRCAAAR